MLYPTFGKNLHIFKTPLVANALSAFLSFLGAEHSAVAAAAAPTLTAAEPFREDGRLLRGDGLALLLPPPCLGWPCLPRTGNGCPRPYTALPGNPGQ